MLLQVHFKHLAFSEGLRAVWLVTLWGRETHQPAGCCCPGAASGAP